MPEEEGREAGRRKGTRHRHDGGGEKREEGEGMMRVKREEGETSCREVVWKQKKSI